MFSLQPSDELVFGDQILDDRIMDQSFIENNYIRFSTSNNSGQLGQTTNVGSRRKQRESGYGCNIRRVMHRDIERKRRQDMSNLFASLRSLLPPEQDKGKLPACDQMQEAANYIKQMQKHVQELRVRRDKLKEKSNLSGAEVASSNDCDNLSNAVTVNLVPDGAEILMSCSIRGSDLGLSLLLAQLPERDLDLVSCVSTRTNGRFLHKILTKAGDMTNLDVSLLQDRLTEAIK